MAAHAGPARGVKIRQKFSQLALVFGNSGETSDAVHLAGPGAAALRIHYLQFAAGHSHRVSALAHGAKIDCEWSSAVQCTQCADTIAASSEEDAELRPIHHSLASLQFRRRLEFDSQTVHVSDRDVLTLLARKDTLYFPPGSAYRYSNSGYVLLGVIVERVSGVSFPEFLRARIFKRLGMSASVAHVEGVDTVPHRAYGYSPGSAGFTPTDQSVTSATLGDGGIYTNVDDLVRWDQALYGDALVDAATLRLATTPPALNGGAETHYGFGWFVDTYRNERRWRHTGETSGFRNAIQRFPDRRFTVIVLTNRNGGEPAAIVERIADALLFGEAR